jgi:hypothetical protein
MKKKAERVRKEEQKGKTEIRYYFNDAVTARGRVTLEVTHYKIVFRGRRGAWIQIPVGTSALQTDVRGFPQSLKAKCQDSTSLSQHSLNHDDFI